MFFGCVHALACVIQYFSLHLLLTWKEKGRSRREEQTFNVHASVSARLKVPKQISSSKSHSTCSYTDSAFHRIVGHCVQPFLGLFSTDVDKCSSTVGVISHHIVHWYAGVVLEDVHELRVLQRPGWVLVVNRFQLLLKHSSLKCNSCFCHLPHMEIL